MEERGTCGRRKVLYVEEGLVARMEGISDIGG
jgi:hypothetical protein